jgi:serine/threonine protein kinase
MTGETGSYRFMAPEVYRHEDYTETVDVYSYGMILYYLLSGRPPWASMNGLMAVERAAKEGDRPNIPRDWDERLSNLLQRCWDENPQARPSFQKILEVLNSYSRKPFVFESLLHLLPLACLLPAFFNYLIIRRRVQDRREFGQTQHS